MPWRSCHGSYLAFSLTNLSKYSCWIGRKVYCSTFVIPLLIRSSGGGRRRVVVFFWWQKQLMRNHWFVELGVDNINVGAVLPYETTVLCLVIDQGQYWGSKESQGTWGWDCKATICSLDITFSAYKIRFFPKSNLCRYAEHEFYCKI